MRTELALRLAVIFVALVWAGFRFERLARPLFAAPAEARLRPFGPRAWGVVVNVFGHARLLRKPYAGLLHAAMFFGFLFLLTAVAQVFGQGVSPLFDLDAVGGSTWIAFGQDVFAVLLLTGVAMAAFQRGVWKPERFMGSNQRDAAIILCLITAVVVGMLMQNAFRVAGGDPSARWRPVSSLIAAAIVSSGVTGTAAAHGATAFAWMHMLAILAFLVYIPGSKHLHMLVGIPNVYLRDLKPAGRLVTPDLEQPTLGLSDIGQLGRKQTLDLYACTECGRCQELCPAFASGKPLSPKLLIMNLRDHLLKTRGVGGHRAGLRGALIGGAVAEETIWSCTTCRACMEACPLFIEHVPKIVDMRRHLAMEAGRVPDGISGAMLSIEQRGHPWAGTRFSRLDWCRDLGVRVLAPGEATDTLLWVGCTAALDARAQKVARSSGCGWQRPAPFSPTPGRRSTASRPGRFRPGRSSSPSALFETSGRQPPWPPCGRGDTTSSWWSSRAAGPPRRPPCRKRAGSSRRWSGRTFAGGSSPSASPSPPSPRARSSRASWPTWRPSPAGYGRPAGCERPPRPARHPARGAGGRPRDDPPGGGTPPRPPGRRGWPLAGGRRDDGPLRRAAPLPAGGGGQGERPASHGR